MNKIILIAGIALITIASIALVHQTHKVGDVQMAADWNNWMSNNNKMYTSEEEAYRYTVYAANRKFIDQNQGVEYTLGENQFMDLTPQEFKAIYLGFRAVEASSTCGTTPYLNSTTPPTSVDWSAKSDVSAVKNQGQCGSCWAFSTTGSLEAVDAIFGSGLGDFSEQQLVDCSTSFGNQGCNGGLMDQAFQYVMQNGITTESDYPYEGVDQTCKTQGGAFKISSCTDITAEDTVSLQNAVAQQPISIAVDAATWQFYSGGVFPSYLCGKSLDHGVLAVGYNEKNQWIVKNSWGPSWGQKGYITLAKGNTCGLANSASFPNI